MRRRPVSRVVPATAMAVAMVAAAVLILYVTRRTTFFFDEWNFLLYRRGGLHSLLAPYNGHFSLIPIALYRLLLDIAGVNYAAFRIVMTVGHLAVGALVFVYARRRVGGYLALLAAVLVLFLGAGWQNILWPFQIAWTISIAAGIGALLLLDRRDRLGDVAACVLLIVSVASTSVGIPLVVGMAVDVAWTRRRWADAWIVAIPLAVYIAWALGYQSANLSANQAFVVPSWIARSAAAFMASLTGLSGQGVGQGSGTVLEFGVPLVLAVIVVLGWRTAKLRAYPGRAVALAVVAVVFWVLTALARGGLASPFASRYEYVDAVVVLLLCIELLRGVRPQPAIAVVLAVLTAGAALSGIGLLRQAGGYLRSEAPVARADLAALDVGRAYVPHNYIAVHFPGFPFILVRAFYYFAFERSVGTPAYSASQLRVAPEAARETADAELLRIHQVIVSPVSGSHSQTGSCRRYGALPAPSGATPTVQVALPPSGLLIRSGPAPVTVTIRRFAVNFTPLGTVPADSQGVIQIGPDGSSQPWKLDVSAEGALTVCRLL